MILELLSVVFQEFAKVSLSHNAIRFLVIEQTAVWYVNESVQISSKLV